jgi:hypothetical protein
VCIPPIVARQRLGKNPPIFAKQRLGRNVTAVTNTHVGIEKLFWTRRFPCGSCRIKESRRLVLPRTSCFICGVAKVLSAYDPFWPVFPVAVRGSGRIFETH